MSEQTGISLAGHPRATRAIRNAKGYGGLGGFALGALLSLRAGVEFISISEPDRGRLVRYVVNLQTAAREARRGG